MLTKIYYLLYKIINQDGLWIIKVDNDISDFLYHIERFKSHDEKYLIVERTINLRSINRYINNVSYYYMNPRNLLVEDIEYLLDFKRFQKFTLRANDNIIKETKHITFCSDILNKYTSKDMEKHVCDDNEKTNKVKKPKYFCSKYC